MEEPATRPFTLVELNRRLVESRSKVFGSKDTTWVGTTAMIVMLLSIVTVCTLGFVLPKEKRWIGLIPTCVELVAWAVLAWDQRRVKRLGDSSQETGWLQQYDELAREDDKTIAWLTSFGREPIERSIETIRERALGETMAFSMVFGQSGQLGLLVVLGAIYTQATSFVAADQSAGMTLVRTSIVAAIAGLYAASWSVNRDQIRRDRLLMILEFSRKRLDNTAAFSVG